MDQAPSLPHSTLELVRHDASAGAPERDTAIVAPENARDHDAPQTAPASGPEIHYNNVAPEAVGNSSENAFAHEMAPHSRHMSSIRKIITAALITLIVVGVAVGVGVGVGLEKKASPESDSRSAASTATIVATARLSPTTIYRPSPTAMTPISQKDALSDTSLAIVESKNGDRHLFFQERSGNIRQGVYSASTQKWSAAFNLVVATDAKNHTPIAAIRFSFIEDPSVPSPNLVVFYVSNNNTLRCRQFDDGFWGGIDDFGGAVQFPDLSAYTVAEESRHLSVGVYATPNLTSVLMLYESSVSGVTLLRCFYSRETGSWKWRNFSSSLFHESQRLKSSLRVPFTLIDRNDTEYIDMLLVAEKMGEYPGFLMNAFFEGSEIGAAGFSSSVKPDSSLTPNSDLLSLTASASAESDSFQFYYLWVNGTSLSSYEAQNTMTTTPFPYKRLAGIGGQNSTWCSVYHQLNATTLMEDIWHQDSGVWTSTTITVDTD